MNEIVRIESFNFIGIATETTNKNEKSSEDLGNLWKRFYTENIGEKIPGKISNNIYAIYTDYESDYKGKYTALIGYKVNSLEQIPEGFTGRKFIEQNFEIFSAKGKMPDEIVKVWIEIWGKDEELNRSYIYDFEVYDELSDKGENSIVDIFIGIKS